MFNNFLNWPLLELSLYLLGYLAPDNVTGATYQKELHLLGMKIDLSHALKTWIWYMYL